MLPPQSVPVCGVVEAYKEQSLFVKYRSQGVQTLIYESTPSTQVSLGNKISQGSTEDPGNVRANILDASKEYAITDIPPDAPGFYSNIFLVRKASGGWRPVIDLKQLNAHSDAPHFHNHTISSVLNSVKRADYAFKIDLQDAYFHVLIHPDSRKYLGLAFENKVYQFRVLPSGLNTAPQVFTRLGHTVAAYLVGLKLNQTKT